MALTSQSFNNVEHGKKRGIELFALSHAFFYAMGGLCLVGEFADSTHAAFKIGGGGGQ